MSLAARTRADGPERLAAAVRALELAARRNVVSLRAGSYLSAIPGEGQVFHECRKYVPGESARRIDWNITARTGEPYVRVHREERQREIFLAVDVSPSMHSGWTERSKLELAVELAATLAVSAVDAGDRLGHVLFADRVLAESRPRSGRRQLWRTLTELLAHTGPWRRRVEISDPRLAIHAIESCRGRRFVVFLISDLLDEDVPRDLEYLRARHDVSLLHVYDPVEHDEAAPVVFPGVAAEGAPRAALTSPGREVRFGELSRELARQSARLGIAYSALSTETPAIAALEQLLAARRRR